MASTSGRRVVLNLTNKSGGGVIAGDVVIVDTTNNEAFTTTTSGAFLGGIGVAQETIANNAAGRVLVSGYAALVNVNASVTRGNYGVTHTVAKQATDGGASRLTGGFCQFLSGGTTPTAHLFAMPDGSSASGNVAADTIWDAAGDLAQGTGANTAAKLTLGAAGTVVRSTGSTNAYAYPPGYELDYVEYTGAVSVTNTAENAADIIVTSNSITYDGTAIWVEYYCPFANPPTSAANLFMLTLLYDNTASTSASIGRLANNRNQVITTVDAGPIYAKRKLTPSAGARIYSIRAIVGSGTGAAQTGGAGGTGAYMPGFIRITKA